MTTTFPVDISNRLLWNFAEVCAMADAKVASVDEMARCMTKVASVALETSKSLEKLAQRFEAAIPVSAAEGSTAAVLWSSVVRVQSKSAQDHATFARDVQERVASRLAEFVTGPAESARKRAATECAAMSRQLDESLAALARAKKKYFRLCEERETKTAGKAADKLKLESDLASQEYTALLASVNAAQDNMAKKLPGLLGIIQDCMAKRNERIKECFSALAKTMAVTSPPELMSWIDSALSTFDGDGDDEEFTSMTEMFFVPPRVALYEAFTPGSSTSAPAAKPAQLPPGWKPTEVRVFRMPIAALMMLQKSTDSTVPRILTQLAEAIIGSASGPIARDLWTTPCSSPSIYDSIEKINRGDFVLPTSAVELAVILKIFLKSLPEPLVPESIFTSILGGPVQPVRSIVNQVLEPNKASLGFLVKFLQRLVAKSGDPAAAKQSAAVGLCPCVMRLSERPMDKLRCKKIVETGRGFILALIDDLDTSSFEGLAAPATSTAAWEHATAPKRPATVAGGLGSPRLFLTQRQAPEAQEAPRTTKDDIEVSRKVPSPFMRSASMLPSLTHKQSRSMTTSEGRKLPPAPPSGDPPQHPPQ